MEGVIKLLVKASTSPWWVIVQVDFLVVKILVFYNVILRWLGLYTLNVVVSIKYLLMKFPTKNGIGQIRRNQAMAQ